MIENKVLLIRPNFAYIYGYFSRAGRFHGFRPPVGLLFVAAMLDKYDIDNAILDAEQERYSDEEIIDVVLNYKPKVIGFTSTTPEIDYVLQLSFKIKKFIPNIIVAVGGPHAIIRPEDVISDDSVDIVCNGEGEIAFTDFMLKLLNNELDGSPFPNIYYKFQSDIIKPQNKKFINNLDSLPFQARYKLDYKKYTYNSINKGKVSFATILSSRGCSYDCAFCCKTMGYKVRYMSAERVVEEIEDIKKNYGIDFIQFNDDTFTIDRNRVTRICNLLIEKDLNIEWHCSVRLDLLDSDLLSIMKKAGCMKVEIGIESGSQKFLVSIKKEIKLKKCMEIIKLIRDNNIQICGFFIIGIPYETKKDIISTIKFAKKLPLDEATFNIMTPYPGTRIFEMAKRGEGIKLLTDKFYEYRRWSNAVIELPDVSRKELIKLQKFAIISFYLRLRSIIYQIKNRKLKNFIKISINYIFLLFK